MYFIIDQVQFSVKKTNSSMVCKLFLFSVKILPGATVCEDCTLEGDITIGGGTVIHPRVTIIAEGGPIIIAEYCIIEEYSTIIHK